MADGGLCGTIGLVDACKVEGMCCEDEEDENEADELVRVVQGIDSYTRIAAIHIGMIESKPCFILWIQNVVTFFEPCCITKFFFNGGRNVFNSAAVGSFTRI